VVRFGIYLQDFKAHSGGLKVVPGSHVMDSTDFSQDQFTYCDVPSEPGDLVCFCQKTLHSPYALRLRDRPNAGLSPLAEDELSAQGKDVFLPPPVGRDVIFMDYAGTGTLADLHIKSRAVHPMNVKRSIVAALDDLAFEAHARDLGITLRMDFGVVASAIAIAKHLHDGKLAPEGLPYFKAFARFCRLSRESSPYFSLFSYPADDSVQATNAALNQVLSRLRKFRATNATREDDLHMGSAQAIAAYAGH
jgi:hypothetical protein